MKAAWTCLVVATACLPLQAWARGAVTFDFGISAYSFGKVDHSETFDTVTAAGPGGDDAVIKEKRGHAGEISALGYTPFQVGYLFENGMHLKTGFDMVFFNATEIFTKEFDPDKDNQTDNNELAIDEITNSDYSITNWVTTFQYHIQLPFAVKPFVGLTLEILGGKRTPVTNYYPGDPAGKPLKIAVGNAKEESAFSITGSAAVFGFGWRINNDWMMTAQGRYLFPLSGLQPPVLVGGLGISYLL